MGLREKLNVKLNLRAQMLERRKQDRKRGKYINCGKEREIERERERERERGACEMLERYATLIDL